MLVHPHDCSECTQIPVNLLAHVGLLDLDGNPLVGPIGGLEFGTMNLGDAGARCSLLFENFEYAVRTGWRATKL